MRRCLALLACACLGIGALAAPALAAPVASRVTIRIAKNDVLRGKVKSPQLSCTQGREVGIYRSVNGGGFNHYGTVHSDSYGQWTFGKPNGVPTGKYYAQVERDGNCKPNQSRNVAIP